MNDILEARFREFAVAHAPGLRSRRTCCAGLASRGDYARKVLRRVWLDERRKPWRRWRRSPWPRERAPR
ncbi:hypothetical protein [Prauserella flavalba]|uniref:hypothetical protein n=1 Tax=Prauserella flavalba TaxID=1477506 RepID=UPI0011B622AC|nr:hypothetical protein [Prauserella flavalba]